MRVLIILLISWVFVANSYGFSLRSFGIPMGVKRISVCFLQVSHNAMSGQTIRRRGRLVIVRGKSMEFFYSNEQKVLITNFQVEFYQHGEESVYKLQGFNRILYQLFIGKEDVNRLFHIEEKGNSDFILIPLYKSQIQTVELHLEHGKLHSINITDIYSNVVSYTFEYGGKCHH